MCRLLSAVIWHDFDGRIGNDQSSSHRARPPVPGTDVRAGCRSDRCRGGPELPQRPDTGRRRGDERGRDRKPAARWPERAPGAAGRTPARGGAAGASGHGGRALPSPVRCKLGPHPPRGARRARAGRARRSDSLLRRADHGGRRADRPARPAGAAAGAGRGRDRAGRAPLPAVRPGPAPRHGALGTARLLRHRRRRGPHGRRADRRLPRVDPGRPLRHRAPHRRARARPLLPAPGRLPRPGRPA